MNPKTYKRELAVAFVIWLAYVVETKDAEIIQMLVWPIFTYTALAFGVDWWGKSNGVRKDTPLRGRPERSGQHSNREDERPDYWNIDR